VCLLRGTGWEFKYNSDSFSSLKDSLLRFALPFVTFTRFIMQGGLAAVDVSMERKAFRLHTVRVLTSLNYNITSRAFLPGTVHKYGHSSIYTPWIPRMYRTQYISKVREKIESFDIPKTAQRSVYRMQALCCLFGMYWLLTSSINTLVLLPADASSRAV
jgi:hypothetical protein